MTWSSRDGLYLQSGDHVFTRVMYTPISNQLSIFVYKTHGLINLDYDEQVGPRCSQRKFKWPVFAGGKNFTNMVDFVNGVLPEGQRLEQIEIPPDQITSVAVLCRADFLTTDDLHTCQHWLPGWLEKDVPDGEALMQTWLDHITSKTNAEISDLEARLETCKDAVIKATLRLDVDRLESLVLSRAETIRNLWQCEGILSRDVVNGGNCAVEAFLHLEAALQGCPKNLPLDFENLRHEMQQLRKTIHSLWVSVSEDPIWQTLWVHFCKGHVDLKKWKEEQKSFNTPKKRRKCSTPFTPDNPSAKKRGHIVPVHAVVPDGVVVISKEDGEEPVSKKRRTGKSAPIETKINFDKYFTSSLAHSGITYRVWMKQHAKLTVMVSLVFSQFAGL